jgi:dTDP-3-amino-3,4,6-trideoxy-alpha-D-glucose transaminase
MGLSTGSLPLTEKIRQEVLSLSMGPHLTEEQFGAVVESIREFAG